MKYILITGASSGLGRAIAVAFARPGTLLILTGRNTARLLETKRQVERQGAQGRILVADISCTSGINKVIRTLKAEISSLDTFVHVAGIWHGQDEVFANTPYEQFPQQVVLDTYMVGLVAPALLVHGLLPLMAQGGNLLTISGTFEDGAKGWLPYYGSKRGLEDLWVGLAQELEGQGVRVHCISPSDVATDAYKKYFPEYIAGSLSPEAVAEEAVRLCTSQVIVPGVVRVVKKGQPSRAGFHQ